MDIYERVKYNKLEEFWVPISKGRNRTTDNRNSESPGMSDILGLF